MRAPAIRLRQNGTTLFVTCLTASQLIDASEIDTWKPNLEETTLSLHEILEEQGYQRVPIRSHYTKVGKYVAGDSAAILPTSILASSRSPLRFEPMPNGAPFGYLEIPQEASLYLVDGQHRVYGLRYAINELGRDDLRDFPLVVTIVDNMKKGDEVRQFYIINNTQKKIRTDLADRLLRIMATVDPSVRDEIVAKGRDWQLAAIEIVDLLASTPGSPWQDRIKRPNSPASREAVAAERSFTTSLKPVLTSTVVLQESRRDPHIIARWLMVYWQALRRLMPEAFMEPRSHVIQKTPGIYSLHLLFPEVLYECLKGDEMSVESVMSLLSRDPDHFKDPEFWRSGGEGAALYNSLGSIRKLYQELHAALFE